MAKVLVGMSGGIDSSVTAMLLKEQGHEVQGITMTVWKNNYNFTYDHTKDACFNPDKSQDIEKIKKICEEIGINHTVLDISDLYESVVLQNFRDEYLNGRTPNPCVWCNQKIKFGAMVDFAKEKGLEFDYFATGHYARIEKEGNRYVLCRGKDLAKDQSYFLYRLSQNQLATTMFPLGEMVKTNVKEIDFSKGFHERNQKESQDFYGGHYTDLLNVEPKEGLIVDTEGKVLGKHMGMWNYTIGQRKGLGVSAPRPLYVIALDPVNNKVIVGYEEHTGNTKVYASSIVWGALESLEKPLHVQGKIRSTGYPMPCTLSMALVEGKEMVCATFDSPVKAATCGQSLVAYDGDKVLCGGIIEKVQ